MVKVMSQPVYGTIANYRIGIRTQNAKWCLIRFADADSVSKAGQLIGRKVVWTQGKKRLIGQIMGLHGKKGVVEAKFRVGVPGWAIGTPVELLA
jgi:ribosomal protein L35AE/L33A